MITNCGLCSGETLVSEVLDAIHHLKTKHPKVYANVVQYIKNSPRNTKEAKGQ